MPPAAISRQKCGRRHFESAVGRDFAVFSRPVDICFAFHRPRLSGMHRLRFRNASPSRIKNVPPPPRKLQIILQGSPEHLECILYMGCDLTDRDAGVCGNLGISLAFETAGDEYVSGLLRHAPDTSPEKILHFGGKNPVRIDALQEVISYICILLRNSWISIWTDVLMLRALR